MKPQQEKFFAGLFFLSLTGFLLFLWYYTSTNGLLLTYDSKAYLFAASTWANKGTLLLENGDHYTNWTPLYPVLLALGGEENILALSKWWHASSLFLFLSMGFLLGRKYLEVPDSYLFFICLAVSTPIFMVHIFLWSEAIFCTLLMFWLWFYLKQNITWREVIILSLLANLLYLQRNAGLFFIVPSVIWLVFYQKEVIKGLVLGTLSAISALLWTFRNYHLGNPTPFVENIWVISWSESYTNFALAFSSWLVPFRNPILATLLFTIFLFGLIFFLVKNVDNISKISWILLSYLLPMLFLRMNIEGESERYIAPLFAFVFLWIFSVLSHFKQIKRYWIVLGFSLWIWYPILRLWQNIQLWL